MSNLYDVLEVCLQEIENGASVDTVLFRYPDVAEELRPILETAMKAQEAAVLGPADHVVHRNRVEILRRAAEFREAKARSSRSLWPVSLRRALVSLAVVVTLFLSSTGLVRAASTTVPGDNLYAVKRTWEDVRLLLTFNLAARKALEVAHENERLEELSELFLEGRAAEVEFIGSVTSQEGDIWLVSNIKVMISTDTDLRAASIAVGDAVRVHGLTRSDGTVLAERVDLLDAGVPLPSLYKDSSELDHNGGPNVSNDQNADKNSGNESNEVDPAKHSDSEDDNNDSSDGSGYHNDDDDDDGDHEGEEDHDGGGEHDDDGGGHAYD